jgi:hypothetical protein
VKKNLAENRPEKESSGGELSGEKWNCPVEEFFSEELSGNLIHDIMKTW